MTTARTIRRGEPDYPARLARHGDSPAELRLRGELGSPAARVAIVGSRLVDARGRDLAHELARDLARAGVSIVSGGAEGVDAAAHEGALAAGGHTVAVFGCGLDVAYPAAHRALFARIVSAGGALLSESLDDAQRPSEWSFPRRNRIVSGMSDAVVVVRARERSGALLTAALARAQGTPVLAVPGEVGEPLAAGTIGLLRQGARVAACAADVLEAVGLGAQLTLPHVAAPTLDGPAAAIYAALGRAPRHADELAREAGLASGPALAALLELELGGLCEQRPGHYFVRRT